MVGLGLEDDVCEHRLDGRRVVGEERHLVAPHLGHSSGVATEPLALERGGRDDLLGQPVEPVPVGAGGSSSSASVQDAT